MAQDTTTTIPVPVCGGFAVLSLPIPGPYHTLAQIKRDDENEGGHYFEPGTLRWFRSRPLRTIYAGCFFIDSIQASSSHPRVYTICVARSEGRGVGGIVERLAIPPEGWNGERVTGDDGAYPASCFGTGDSSMGTAYYASRRSALEALRGFLARYGVSMGGRS